MFLSNYSTLFMLCSFTAFIFYIYIGLYVLLINRKSKLNVIFSLFSLSMGIWAFCFTFFFASSDETFAYFWYSLGSIGYCTYFAFALHFCLLLTNNKPLKVHTVLNYLLYLPSFAFLLLGLTGNLSSNGFLRYNTIWHQIVPLKNLWFYLYVSISMLYLLFGFYTIFLWSKNSNSIKIKKQATIILYTGIISFLLGSATNVMFPILGIRILPQISHILMLLFLLGIRYSIDKYKLMILTPEVATNEILSRVIDMVAITDTQNNITMINKSLSNILGYSEEALLGKPIKYLISKDIIKNMQDSAFDLELEKHSSIELKVLTKNKYEIPVTVSISAFHDDGLLIGRVFVLQDMRHIYQLKAEIDEKARLTNSLIVTNEKLKQLDEQKSNFLSTLSQELKTPLTAVLGFSRIIKSKLETDLFTALPTDNLKLQKTSNQITDTFSIIISEGERLTALVNDVLDLDKLESDNVQWKFEYVPLDNLIKQAINSVTSLYEPKGITIDLNIAEGLSPVYCDKIRILQVLTDILTNAIKASSEKGLVTCTVKRKLNVIKIVIKDCGLGISPENQKRVFESYKHIFDSSTDKPSKICLGLPICKQIIEHHGGRIWVESELNFGSRFCFTLPVIKQYSSSTSCELDEVNYIESTIKKLHPSKKILVVDDDVKTIRILKQYFEDKGYQVIGITDSVNTASITKSEKPALIIMDIMMPKINGLDVAAILKNNPDTKEVPIFLLTIIEEREKAYSIGIDGYFNKPINFQELYTAVEEKLSS